MFNIIIIIIFFFFQKHYIICEAVDTCMFFIQNAPVSHGTEYPVVETWLSSSVFCWLEVGVFYQNQSQQPFGYHSALLDMADTERWEILKYLFYMEYYRSSRCFYTNFDQEFPIWYLHGWRVNTKIQKQMRRRYKLTTTESMEIWKDWPTKTKANKFTQANICYFSAWIPRMRWYNSDQGNSLTTGTVQTQRNKESNYHIHDMSMIC